MTALTEFLFPVPARRSVGGIVRWWEARRLHYNAVVGGAGLLSLATVSAAELIFFDGGVLPWQPVVAFAVMANLCYCLGPAVEIAIEKLWRGQVLPVGPALFRMGLTFSVGLALLPILITLIAVGAKLVFSLF